MLLAMRKLKLTRRRVMALVLLSLSCAAIAHRLVRPASAEDDREALAVSAGDEREAAVEAASFARAEFFGAQALIPYPTAEARNRLAEVREKYPSEPRIALRLSQLDEKLGRF